jgi:hypothetical protein
VRWARARAGEQKFLGSGAVDGLLRNGSMQCMLEYDVPAAQALQAAAHVVPLSGPHTDRCATPAAQTCAPRRNTRSNKGVSPVLGLTSCLSAPGDDGRQDAERRGRHFTQHLRCLAAIRLRSDRKYPATHGWAVRLNAGTLSPPMLLAVLRPLASVRPVGTLVADAARKIRSL